MKENIKDVILLNNLFNGEYIKNKVGGEVINMYQSDNENFYIYVNPYGNISKQWDNKIMYILFIRSVGNKTVKIVGKAKIEEQINCNAVFSKKNNCITDEQQAYIDDNNITYGKTKLNHLGSLSMFYITFKAESIHKSKKDIYLSLNDNVSNNENITILKNVKKINNQSQKLYITKDNENYQKLKDIINNSELWEESPVCQVDTSKYNKTAESFLSIIKKENDELVNSNLLAYFLENDDTFWSNFVENVLKLDIEEIKKSKPKIFRETIDNIDLFIEVGGYAIVIENKIKSGINGTEDNGYSQLEKYVEKAEVYFEGDKTKLFFYILRPNYNNENYEKYNASDRYKEIKYSDIFEIIKNCEKDLYFEEFKKVVKKHSKEYDNELFEVMNEGFIKQIKSNITKYSS